MIQGLHKLQLQPTMRPVLGAEAVLASCADEPSASLFGGMDLLRWPKDGTRVAVAILGHSELNLRLAATLADHLRLIEPDGLADRLRSSGGRAREEHGSARACLARPGCWST
jgi:hypothetical protein